MLIAIDADGVLIDRKGIPRGKSIKGCKPVKNSLQAVEWMIGEGHEVYVLTNRDYKEVEKWLNKTKFPKLYVSNTKLKRTVMYIDDRAVRFTNWQDICKLLG